MFNMGYEYNSNYKIELVNMIFYDMCDCLCDGLYYDDSEMVDGVEEFCCLDIIFEECEMVLLQLKGMYNFFQLGNGVFFDWYVGMSCVLC